MVYPNWFVCVMGMGTVIAGLVILIFAVKIMGMIVGRGNTAQEVPAAPAVPAAPPARAASGEITPEAVAAISAAIVEDMGLPDINALRIVSIKRV